MPDDATIVSGRRVAERYRLVEERPDHAWNAVDETLRRTVVVHLLPSGAASGAKDHFTAEARCLARLNHQNIVCTYDTGVDGDGTSYRVDELAGGTPLELVTVAARDRVAYALQMVRAIADAHAAGLAHGNLGAHSVLIDDTGRVQLRGLRLPAAGEVDAAQRADVTALIALVGGLAPPGAGDLRDIVDGWRRTPPASVRAMLDDVAAIPDDTVDTIPPHLPPAPAGVPDAHRRGRAVFISLAGALVIAAVIVAVVVPATKKTAHFDGPVTPIRMSAKSFDPQGDKSENEAAAQFAVDGNAGSVWKTDRYRSANFGRLKDGVGLILQADAATEFDTLTITSPTRGWTMEIYVADQPGASLGDWGSAVGGGTVQNAATTIDLTSARGSALLVWITDPGPSRQVRISDITVRGRGPQ